MIVLTIAAALGAQSAPPPASQAPASKVEQCARTLAGEWRRALAQKPVPPGSDVRFELFTISPEAADKAAKRVRGEAGDILGNVAVVGMGPGRAIIASAPAENWRSSSDARFAQLCEIGVEAKAGYVELGVYRPHKADPLFYVRWTSDDMPSGYTTFKVPEGTKPPF